MRACCSKELRKSPPWSCQARLGRCLSQGRRQAWNWKPGSVKSPYCHIMMLLLMMIMTGRDRAGTSVQLGGVSIRLGESNWSHPLGKGCGDGGSLRPGRDIALGPMVGPGLVLQQCSWGRACSFGCWKGCPGSWAGWGEVPQGSESQDNNPQK